LARKRSDTRGPEAGKLPGKADILAFIQAAQEKVGKREIARAFGIKGADRIELKRLLAELVSEGHLAGNRRHLQEKGKLPAVAGLEITRRDSQGDLLALPLDWAAEDGPPPLVLVLPPKRARDFEPALGVGDRVLARIKRLDAHDDPDEVIEGLRYAAEPMKRIERERRRLLAIFHRHARGGGTLQPVDRKELKSWAVQHGDEADATDGDLVRFDLSRRGRSGLPLPRVLEVLGNPRDQKKISLIAIHAHGIPEDFPAAALAELERLEAPTLAGRTDLRKLPLITIDPVDARDHDDAVHAAPDESGSNPGGFIVHVAIADVAQYVRPGTALDREAQLRGNSVYFPDRVVPMLPERISNDLCSLREHEDRPCLAVRLVFDRDGAKRGQTFLRALMRSAAKLSYEEAQAAIGGRPSDRAAPLLERALKPLWAAYEVLHKARSRREPLDLDLPERKLLLDSHGHVARVIVPERLEAHRLIEEFMIQANVAAAEELEKQRTPVVYRCHDQPAKERLVSLREFLETLDLTLPGAAQLRPEHFNRVLKRARETPSSELVSEVVLRAQAQAEYVPENYGHFGLNLKRYAHFTSPIRRYADLLVHRALIRGLKLGKGGLGDDEIQRLPDVCRLISQTERRAMAAERETTDRLISAHLAEHIGAVFAARISGVTRSGLFVRLADSGADGFIPAATIGEDFYRYEETAHALIGDRTGETYRLGDGVEVKLVEAVPTAGALRFEMISPGKRGSVPRKSHGRRPPYRGRPRR